MRLLAIALLGCLAAASRGAQAQAPQSVVNRMIAAYRSMQTVQATGAWTMKGEKDLAATLVLAAARPNRFLLEIKGDKMNTVVASDGTDLLMHRPDRNIYTRARAPRLLMGGDILGRLDVPSPGARIIAALLQNQARNTDFPLAQALARATVDGPRSLDGRQVYVVALRYDEDRIARLFVSEGDWLIRKVTAGRGGLTEVVEVWEDPRVDQPVAPETFLRKVPDNARQVSALPPLEPLRAQDGNAPRFTVRTVAGETVSLSGLKGKVVLLNFFFNT